MIVQNVALAGYGRAQRHGPAVVAMAAVCPGQVIYFALDRHHPLMATQRAQGQRCVFVTAAHRGRRRIPAPHPLRDILLRRRHRLPGRELYWPMAAFQPVDCGNYPPAGRGHFINDADRACRAVST